MPDSKNHDFHRLADECLISDDHGFFVPRCTCGWAFGPVPDVEILIDVLIEHAADAGMMREEQQSGGHMVCGWCGHCDGSCSSNNTRAKEG